MPEVTQRPLDRPALINALRKVRPAPTPSMAKLTEALEEIAEQDGSVPVGRLHETLFPASESPKSTSAQASKLLKALADAAEARGVRLSHRFTGPKRGGVAKRTLVFEGPSTTPRALTDGLRQLDDHAEALIEDQCARPLMEEPLVCLMTFNRHEYDALRDVFVDALPPLRPSLREHAARLPRSALAGAPGDG